jgi:hypothetical protein
MGRRESRGTRFALGLLITLSVLGCASPQKRSEARHGAVRAQSLEQLPADAPPLYREVLEFLWAERDRDARRSERGGVSWHADVLWESPRGNLTLERDKKLAAKKEEYARQLLALQFTGDFAHDLLLDRVRAKYFEATGVDARAARDARAQRFSLAGMPLEVYRYWRSVRERERARSPALDAADYLRTFHEDCTELGAIYASASTLPPKPTFAMLAGKLLGTEQVEAGGLFSVVGNAGYRCLPLVYAELARVAKAELARAPDGAPAPMPEHLQRLSETLGREADPLLRDTYAWLLGVARDSGGLDETRLRAAGLAVEETGRHLRFIADLTSTFATKVARERAAAPWAELVSRGLERGLERPFEDDFPALMALLLLREARPEAATPELTQALERRLEPWSGKEAFPARRFLPWAAARLASKPGEVLAELLPLEWLALEATGLNYSILDDRTREGMVRNVDGSLHEPLAFRELRRARLDQALRALRAATPADSASSTVLTWLSGQAQATLSLDGALPSGFTRCVKGDGYRVVPPAADVLAFRVVSDDLSPRVKGSAVRPTAASAEAARARLLIRALEQELEQVEIASDYASYVSARAARLKAADDSYRWGMETARDRNVDAAYAKVQETTAGTAGWANAERERILGEIAALRAKVRPGGTQKESAIYAASGMAQLKITYGDRDFGTWGGKVYFEGFDEEDVRTKANAKQSEILCGVLHREYRGTSRKLSALLDGLAPKGDAPAEKAAVGFSKERSRGTLNAFLRALP